MHWFIKFLLGFLIVVGIWLLISEVIPRVLPEKTVSDTSVFGLQLRRQTWSGEIRIVGDLITLPGAEINILPGTKIIVSSSSDRSNFDYLPWHLKSGLNTGQDYHGVRNGELFWDESHKIHLYFSKLNALGTKQQPIILTSDSVKGSPWDFNSIYIGSGVISNLKASNYRRLEVGSNVSIQNSSFKDTAECSICVEEASPNISSNTFNNSLREYIWLKGSSSKVTDNFFLNSQGEGIVVDPDVTGSQIISNNDFEMPMKTSIDVLSGDEDQGGLISDNTFVGSTYLKLPCDSKIKVVGNNLQGILSFQGGGCNKTYTLGTNYFGTQDTTVILREKVVKDPAFNLIIPSTLKDPPLSGPR